MNSLIKSLKTFAKQDFPVNKVSRYIYKKNIPLNSIKKYSFFSKNTYTRNMIYKDKNFEVLLICWNNNQMAPIHGHEGEKCWFKVLKGELKIKNYRINSKKPLELEQTETINAPPGYVDGPADVHSIINNSGKSVETLHIYAKPYNSCEIYDLKTGQIKRMKMKYYSINGIIC